ncbi:hypothetical protein C8P68_101387 [Mucilaginibacter yixingensis]|uniref:Uncharacterized protein n=1 Tax=Mucilaginibacter yixingensis TaxID=1295612 RepID=A0A2T5JFI7_9SPHI|nr:hypothetical protein [Mucilaginibacter yixingensis]PTR01154.1 hypothetical protein C8P68_101387 [Mucilaginibacter yixingensis]
MKKTGALLLLMFIATLRSFSQTPPPPPPSQELLDWQKCTSDCFWKMLVDEAGAYDAADAASIECLNAEMDGLMSLPGPYDEYGESVPLSNEDLKKYNDIIKAYMDCQAAVAATLQAALVPFQEAEELCIQNCGSKPAS